MEWAQGWARIMKCGGPWGLEKECQSCCPNGVNSLFIGMTNCMVIYPYLLNSEITTILGQLLCNVWRTTWIVCSGEPAGILKCTLKQRTEFQINRWSRINSREGVNKTWRIKFIIQWICLSQTTIDYCAYNTHIYKLQGVQNQGIQIWCKINRVSHFVLFQNGCYLKYLITFYKNLTSCSWFLRR